MKNVWKKILAGLGVLAGVLAFVLTYIAGPTIR
jgi:hypothetical protein